MKILKSLLLVLMMLSTGGLYAQDERIWSLQVGFGGINMLENNYDEGDQFVP